MEEKAEELRAFYVQSYKQVRELVLMIAWNMGKELEGENLRKASTHLGLSEKLLKDYVKFYDKFPDLELVYELSEGEAISWSTIRRKYLKDAK